MKKRVRSLSIFLAKPGTKETDALEPEVVQSAFSIPVARGENSLGTLYAQQNPIRPPSWLGFFSDSLDDPPKLRSGQVSAVFLIRSGGRLFALTFGQGRHLLRLEAFEERFGLRVTLNSVNPLGLRAVDVATLEANPFHAKRQSSRAAPLGDFGINLEQDLLRAVTGRPVDEALGSRMTGIDSLTVRVRVDLASLRPLLLRYLQKNEERGYLRQFPWVDHVAEIRDPSLKQLLFEKLIDSLKGSNGGAAIWAAIPEVIDWTAFDSFKIGSVTAEYGRDDITLDAMLETLEGSQPSLEWLKTKRVFCMADANPIPLQKWSFLQCLTAEIDHAGATHILNAGTWYRIGEDYTAQIDEDVAELSASSHALPEWGDENEDVYNARVAHHSAGKLALMDCIMIAHAGMANPIEFCDLYSTDHHLIHIKRYGQSSVLSHLFMQGFVSAECFLSDPAFRKAVNLKLPPSHTINDPTTRPSPDKFEIAYAVGSKEIGPLKLPFFSRVTLRNVARTLSQSFGFKVTLTKIPINLLADVKTISRK